MTDQLRGEQGGPYARDEASGPQAPDSPSTRPQKVRLEVGDLFPTLTLDALDGERISIPDESGQLTHLQLRRFAGCPICNLHLRDLTMRLHEVRAANVREVVVFHSTVDELRKYQDDMPFAVVPDPTRALYTRFGVETGARAVLRPGAWRALPRGWSGSLRTAATKRRAPLPLTPTGGNLGLPADILIASTGNVVAVKYGEHAYDQWTVDEILAHSTNAVHA